MSFIIKLERVREILERQGRVSPRALERELQISGEELDDLIAELVEVQQVARREGRILVWAGGSASADNRRRTTRQRELRAALATDECWEDSLRQGEQLVGAPAAENMFAVDAIRASGARVCARLGMVDAALLMLSGVLPALERTPGWASTYNFMAPRPLQRCGSSVALTTSTSSSAPYAKRSWCRTSAFRWRTDA